MSDFTGFKDARERATLQSALSTKSKGPFHFYVRWDPQLFNDLVQLHVAFISEHGTVNWPVIRNPNNNYHLVRPQPHYVSEEEINEKAKSNEVILIIQCINIFHPDALYAGKIREVKFFDDVIDDKRYKALVPKKVIDKIESDRSQVNVVFSLTSLEKIELARLSNFS
ncbi:MAG: hypothetical protein K9K66_10770 [Desulfarculaceae bacterium]|nr:hypothetical protein [Desulfarculaceae bacterium]MCF8102130.1 hypothetical protein [Desulfarculaceae bacterium]MCF8118325.1 hypothetical protein [Desulfarculaceae bacterium]